MMLEEELFRSEVRSNQSVVFLIMVSVLVFIIIIAVSIGMFFAVKKKLSTEQEAKTYERY